MPCAYAFHRARRTKQLKDLETTLESLCNVLPFDPKQPCGPDGCETTAAETAQCEATACVHERAAMRRELRALSDEEGFDLGRRERVA
jgi:hypothetical protein